MKIPKNYQRILLHTGDWGVTIQGDTPLIYAGITKVYNNNVEEVGLSSTESSNSDDNTTTLQSKIECKGTTNN